MKILLATDGSRYALAAARALARWISRPGATVDVLAVIPSARKSDHTVLGARHPIRPGAPRALSGKESAHGGVVARRKVTAEWHGAAGRWLAEAANLLSARGMRVRLLTRSGNPAVVTSTRAAAEHYDVVVVGAKGRGDAPFFDIGSVALAVLEHAAAPVLMVRARSPKQRPAPTRERPLQVLLATDGGPESDQAAASLAALLNTPHAQVRVMSVADRAVGGTLDRRHARAIAKATTDRLVAHGLSAEPIVAEGAPAERIEEAARAADLVVMGSRPIERIEKRHLGSVSLEVARSAPCSVLVIRDQAPNAARTRKAVTETSAPPFEVAYRNVDPSPAVEERLRGAMARLHKVAPDLGRARVTIARPHSRRRKGNLYEVHVDLTVPGREVAITRTAPAHRQDETLLTAVDEAYEKARRALVEAGRKSRNGRRESAAATP